ncbi:Structural maintenance of chromosomes protein 5 [Armadillidium nasatum]|uniref:Structural maintenance of chromosomes protein 5 n=1 Tax=Armadillidium nasatum TaxID=96803 RepID=A0A5N5SZ95_9CRUS|nr:Structural maintenance of chromosomes protein 5 [Armadillidium nasatum]
MLVDVIYIIEVELQSVKTKENYIIRREFSKSSTGGGRSRWYLQGRETSEEKIKGLVTRLGIQVGNLCQFLPQDRVIEFAKMNNVELLQSTEKAVGEIELYEQHQTLQDFGKNQQEVDTQLTKLRVELENQIRINSQLEDQVKNIRAKEGLDQSIEALEQTLFFSRYNRERDRHKKLGEQLEDLIKERVAIEKKMGPKRKDLQNIRDNIRKDEKLLKQQYDKLEELIRQNENIVTRLKEEEENIDKAKEDYRNTQERASRREKDIIEKRNGIKIYETQLEKINEKELLRQLQNLTLSISENNNRIENIRDNINNFESALKIKLNDIEKCCHELRKIRDGKNKKLQILQSRNRSAFLAAEWLLNNRDKSGLFKGVVHEPLFFLLECGDLDSKYVENVISNQDLIAFVCEEKDDVRTLKLEANKHKWAINILYSPPVDPRTYQPTHKIENLRPFGFMKYLRDAIRAPPSILGYLCRNYNIHNIPIAQKADLNNVPEDIKLYFVGNQRFFIRRSRYDQRISTDVSEINAPYYLRQASNSEDEERLMFQLEGLKREKIIESRIETNRKQLLEKEHLD